MVNRTSEARRVCCEVSNSTCSCNQDAGHFVIGLAERDLEKGFDETQSCLRKSENSSTKESPVYNKLDLELRDEITFAGLLFNSAMNAAHRIRAEVVWWGKTNPGY
jgi:hypothetical protein